MDFDGVIAQVDEFFDLCCYALWGLIRRILIAGSVRVHRDLVPVPAQEPPHWLAADLAAQIPQGHVQGPDGGHGRPARSTRHGFVHLFPELGNAERISPYEQGCQIAGDHPWIAAAANALQTLIGVDEDDGPRPESSFSRRVHG